MVRGIFDATWPVEGSKYRMSAKYSNPLTFPCVLYQLKIQQCGIFGLWPETLIFMLDICLEFCVKDESDMQVFLFNGVFVGCISKSYSALPRILDTHESSQIAHKLWKRKIVSPKSTKWITPAPNRQIKVLKLRKAYWYLCSELAHHISSWMFISMRLQTRSACSCIWPYIQESVEARQSLLARGIFSDFETWREQVLRISVEWRDPGWREQQWEPAVLWRWVVAVCTRWPRPCH